MNATTAELMTFRLFERQQAVQMLGRKLVLSQAVELCHLLILEPFINFSEVSAQRGIEVVFDGIIAASGQ